MGGAKAGASKQFVAASSGRSQRAFDTGLPWMQKGIGMATQAVELGGEPEYLGRALEGSQSLALDAMAGQGRAEEIAQLIASKGLGPAGNNTGAMNPEAYGAKMAQFVANSGANRANNRVNQMLEAAGVSLGGAGGAADAQLRAYSNQLGAIGMLPTHNQTYADVLAGVNAAGAIGGGLYQAGVFQPSAQLQPLGTQRTFAQVNPQTPQFGGLLQPLPVSRRY